MRSSYLKLALGIFIGLGILFIPFPYELLSFHYTFIQKTWGKFLFSIVNNLNYFDYILPEIQSDSILLYVLILVLWILSICLSLLFKKRITSLIQSKYFTYALHFYLALHLLKYGWSKLFLEQFYTPEPNTLGTPLGHLDPDILYWSVIGINPNYQIFLGAIEVICGLLLLFKPTQKIGLWIALSILVNIVAINFLYDISVKVFASFLTLVCLYLLAPEIKKWVLALMAFKPNLTYKKIIIGVLLGGFLLAECVYMQIPTPQEPQLFSGTYHIMHSSTFKKLFFHKEGYLIFQRHDNTMTDFKYEVNLKKQQLIITDYTLQKTYFDYTLTKNKLWLKNASQFLEAQRDSTPAPALQSRFHWTVEGVE